MAALFFFVMAGLDPAIPIGIARPSRSGSPSQGRTRPLIEALVFSD
jgi:hypothetical protein